MCRIVGIVDFNGSLKEVLEERLISMRDSLAHGGPDDAGIYTDKENGIALGHRRLSIIDTSPAGHQPMSNHDQTIWITYNGEIYNFQELRNELVSSGYSFKSRTDTEVLIHGYEYWGIETLLSKLQGMFAFAIYDKRENDFRLTLARDRFGIKPLYYFYDKKRFIFASEVNGVMKSGLVTDKKNLNSLIYFLQMGSVPEPLTTVENVFSLPAGHYMTISKTETNIKKHWDLLDFYKNSSTDSLENTINKGREYFLRACKLHLVSDVPVGVFLSGGLDSSSLVSVCSKLIEKKLTTISINFDEPDFNEGQYARLVAERFKTEHHEIILKSSDFINQADNIFLAMDQPTIDGVNTYFISHAAKSLELKVVLSGIGGDEVFLGYKHYRNTCRIKLLQKTLALLPNRLRRLYLDSLLSLCNITGFNRLSKLEYLKNPSDTNSYFLYRGLFTPGQIQKILGISKKELNATDEIFSDYKFNSLIECFNYLDFHHYLQDQILKDTDFMSMSCGVEVRVPFLDHKLVEYITGVKPSLKLSSNTNKFLLTEIVKDLPLEIIHRSKMGFVFPFEKWIKKEWGNLKLNSIRDIVSDKIFFNDLSTNFSNGKVHWSRVWGLFVLEKFLR